jgi:hypothetical protein
VRPILLYSFEYVLRVVIINFQLSLLCLNWGGRIYSTTSVAGGAVVNILILAVLSNIYTEQFHQFAHIHSLIWITILLCSLSVWLFLEANSYGFELRAGEMVQDALLSSEQNKHIDSLSTNSESK